ncbi:MAG: hypothetical protein IJ946_09100 [Clostridia bacterium]|nr:hypothetical protein [Clostridia bacterium]
MAILIVMCLYIIVAGITESYKQMRKIGFGEYKNAVEYSNGVLRILDFKIEIKD